MVVCCLIQGTLQADSRRSMDALERLPALLAASLPVTDVTPLQNMAARQQPPALAQIAPADRVWLQGVLENALQLAAERVLKKQVGLKRELGTFEASRTLVTAVSQNPAKRQQQHYPACRHADNLHVFFEGSVSSGHVLGVVRQHFSPEL